jgi:peptidoglycan biosynthesis protein MviN/MurJ (putative lipid II flippase)
MRYYDLVMMTDFIVSCVGTLGFLFFHRHLSSIPVFLALGYAIASLVLILKAYRVTNLWGSPWAPAMRQIFTNFRRMLLLYPIGFIHSSLDRLFQSYLFPGAIAACGYSQQLLAPLLELFAFDEAFVVPLSASEGRVQKTHRLMAGFILLSVPVALFLMWKSPAVISVMFQYGHFDQRAQAMTSSIFRVLIVVIVTGTLNTPLVRLLQISNKIYQTSYIFLANALLAFPLNLLLVFRWHWRVTGTTWALVLASVGNLITAFWIVAREGHPVPWTRLLRYFGWACSASLLAIALAWYLPHMPKPALDLALSGAAFWAMIGLLYWPVRKQIQFILYG